MFYAYTMPRYQVNVYRTIGPLVGATSSEDKGICEVSGLEGS